MEGNESPFAIVYAREAERLLVFLARRTLDVALAADLTAETLAIAYSSWSRLERRSEQEVRAWLFTVARRQLSRYHRRARVELRAVQRLGICVPTVHEDDLAVIEQRAGLESLRVVLGEELERLSAEQRAAVRLRVVEERSYDEVARLLGVSEQTARARVSRGLAALARALGPQRASGGLVHD